MMVKYTSVPVEGEVKPVKEEVDGGEEHRLRFVNLVCDAVDHEGGLAFSSPSFKS